ncbi:glycosyltransferase family 2 protein [Candidatus Contubernalis alkaliaceticus]|uniref:glycosyltransferase family 2 protein n=1 Tax=Candidatus Contubernalis alkaliaceticus TaxID=338645 RepID=UPI001F4C0187|nr:glycosyltransferase family 2 protein [Candidatus Contubernalis alkalaceticus]UNC92533.1 glycosyltransferase family 2 protein [Candidatus Contubernalis alkalaceticus]
MTAISVIIPAYNEEDKIGETLRAIFKIPEIKEVIVVDDGSNDMTSEIASKQGARVINMHKNTGKSNAVYQGMLQAKYDLIALVDADLEESAFEVRKLIYPLLRNEADMTVAHFKDKHAGGGFGIAKKITAFFLVKMTGKAVQSPLSGQRVLKKTLLEEVSNFSRGFGLEFGLTAISLGRGLRVIEIETDMVHRIHGKSLKGFIHRGRQMIDIFKVLFIILIYKKEVVK